MCPHRLGPIFVSTTLIWLLKVPNFFSLTFVTKYNFNFLRQLYFVFTFLFGDVFNRLIKILELSGRNCLCSCLTWQILIDWKKQPNY
jgi:hypothetical protein